MCCRFVCCYLPYAVLASLKQQHGGDTFRLARDASMVLCFCNSFNNAIIYGAMNLDFRHAFSQLLGCRACLPSNRGVVSLSAFPDSSSLAEAARGTLDSRPHVQNVVPVMHCYSVYHVTSSSPPGDAEQKSSSWGGEPLTSSDAAPTVPTVDI